MIRDFGGFGHGKLKVMSVFIDYRHILSIARSNFNLPFHNFNLPSKKPFGFNYRPSIYHPKNLVISIYRLIISIYLPLVKTRVSLYEALAAKTLLSSKIDSFWTKTLQVRDLLGVSH